MSPESRRWSGARLSGIVLVLVGIAFWVRSPFTLAWRGDRWWALLMLVPLVFLLAPREGRKPSPGRIRAAGAILAVAAWFLLTPGTAQGWPLLLIVMGIAALLA
jgi:hypothetical protein